MEQTILGRTGLTVGRTGFGAIPIQRISFDDAKLILQKAFEGGITFYDTARGYSDSEDKIGNSLSSVRKQIIIASKSGANSKKEILEHIETSLEKLKTDYIDIYQLHNPDKLPNPDDIESSYAGLVEAKKKGLIRFIGISNHKIDSAIESARSGLYDTIQFPLCYVSNDKDLEIIEECKKNNVGIIGMKPLCGGIIKNIPAAFAYLRQYKNLVPIWGLEKVSELEEILSFEDNPFELDKAMLKDIENDKIALAGDFCRGCGYCLPCPAEIPISMAARINHLLKRSTYWTFITKEWQEKMNRINNCTHCNSCKKKCPYSLDTPQLLKKSLENYKIFCADHSA